MDAFKQTDSGLMVPVERKPEREYGPLELRYEDERAKAQKAFQSLLEMGSASVGGIMLDDKLTSKARKDAILHLARQLMGEKFEWEELC